jgi:dTDP-4-amino-4,6-dideoxygalactose transaminase
MITTSDPEIAQKCRTIRQHGMARRYYHDELGYNFRMTDIHAAIGLAQLNKLAHFNRARQHNASHLTANLKGVTVPVTPDGCEHVYHQYSIRVQHGRRDELRTHLHERGVMSEVYYPVPVHKQHFYIHDLGYQLDLPEAERTAQEILSLPVHPALTQTELAAIVSGVNSLCL